MTHARGGAATKLVALLEALTERDSASRDGLTVAEVSRALGWDKSIASRQLRALTELGLVERDAGGRHRLGWRLFSIAARAGDQRLLLLAPPVMRRLTQLVRERVHLSLRRGADVFTILSESPQRMIEAVGWMGRTAPLHCTSSGRALLFDHTDADVRQLLGDDFEPGPGPNAPATIDELIDRLNTARHQGFAMVVNEFDDDLTAVAAPIRDVYGHITAALNISAPSYRFKDQVGMAGHQIRQAALHLTNALSAPPDGAPS